MTSPIVSTLLLALLSVSYSVAVVRVERLRLAVTAGEVPNILSVWAFTGAMLLPLPLALALVVISYAGEWPARRTAKATIGHYLYSTAALATATAAASVIVNRQDNGLLGVVFAILAFTTVNIVLIAAAICTARQWRVLRMFASPSAHASELVTLGAGAVLADAMSHNPAWALLVLPGLAVLHRAVLLDAIRSTRSFDKQTGLWTEQAWKVQGRQMLRDAVGHVALLVIDPDYPHLEGHIVRNLGSGVKQHDLVGRYGTRQVAVLMPVGPACAGELYASRIRANLARANISATVGMATTVDDDLETLIIQAVSNLMSTRAIEGVTRQW